MIKNKLIHKNIIKALSIGLSFAMVAQPITAMAAEDNNDNQSNANSSTIEEENDITDEAEDKANNILVEVKTAENTAKDATEPAKNVPSETVKNAGSILDNGIEIQNLEKNIADAITDLNLAEDFDNIAKDKAEKAEEQITIANESADKASELVEQAEKIVSDTQEVVDETKAIINNSSTAINNSNSVNEANQIYNNAETAVSNANTTVNEAEQKLTEINNNFKDVKDTYNEAVDKFNELNGEFNTAETGFDGKKTDASNGVAGAGTGINKIVTKAEDLEAAALQAKEEVENSGIAYIKNLEDAIINKLAEGKNIPFKGEGSYAEFVDAIVKYYYVPEMLEGEFINAEWHRFSGDYVYDNNEAKSTKGDVLNYCVITYKDIEGNEHQKILNYKIANSNKTNDANWPGVVIFEKTEHDVLDHHDVTLEDLEALENNEILTKKNDSYIKNEESYYKLSKESTTETLIEENENVEIVGEDKTEYVFENDKLVKIVKNDIVETTFTGASLDAQEACLEDEKSAEDAYKAELQRKINALEEGETLLIGEIEFTKDSIADLTGYSKTEKTSYSASGTFSEKFIDKVKKYTDKYEFTNGTYLLGIGENHNTDEITHYNEDDKVIIEYAKVTKVNNANYSWLYDAIISWGNDKDTLEKKLTEKFAAEGKIFVGIDPTNWSIGTADVFIIDAQELATEFSAETEEEAEEAFYTEAEKHLSENAQLYNVNVLTKATTTYGYSALDYYIKKVFLKQNEIISTETFDLTQVNLETEYRNDNWYTGDVILLTQEKEVGMDYKTDGKQSYNKNDMMLNEEKSQITKDFRDTLQAAEDLAKQYQVIAEKAKEAQDKFKEAKKNVDILKNIIDNIETTASINSELTDFDENLEIKLTEALNKFEQIKKDRDDLVNKLTDLKNQLNNKISDLTREDDNAGTPPSNTDNGLNNISNQNQPPAQTSNDENVVPKEENIIPEADVALSNAPVIEVEKDGPAIVKNVYNENVALANAFAAEKHMNWAWLILLLILGTTGLELYYQHLKNKNEKNKK